jgi:ABC-type antimicrobial peptide transport system permease subunit
MLGIVIGVSSVIVLMALGAGAQQGIMDQMGSLINNNISISTKGGTTVYTNDDVKGYVKAITLTPELADEIEQAFPQLSGAVTYGSTTIGNVANGNNSNMASFAGVPIDYFIKMQSAFSQGENFNASDFENSSDVAIINKNVVEMLFTNKSPLGEKVTVSNRDYTVI